MLMTFRSNAYTNITMFGSIGLQMVNMMGYREHTSGAIKAEDVPEALRRLKSALAVESESTEPLNPDDEAEDDEQDDPPVGLASRAIPLLEMLNAAIHDECHIMWDSE